MVKKCDLNLSAADEEKNVVTKMAKKLFSQNGLIQRENWSGNWR